MGLNRKPYQGRGITSVEFALALPILLLLLFGVLEYGWLFSRVGVINNATRNAVRLSVVPDATTAEVEAQVDTLMAAAGMGSSGYTVTISPSNIGDLESGTMITITTEVTYANVDLIGLAMIPTPTTLRAQAVMAKEGP